MFRNPIFCYDSRISETGRFRYCEMRLASYLKTIQISSGYSPVAFLNLHGFQLEILESRDERGFLDML